MYRWTGFSKSSALCFNFSAVAMLIAAGCSTIGTNKEQGAVPSDEKKATLIYMADLHGQLVEHPEMFWRVNEENKPNIAQAGGLARIAKVVNDIKTTNPKSVLFMDAGDTIQGSGIAGWTKGEVLIPILNEMNLDLAIPGNWEVVYGTKILKERVAELHYPMIAANIVDAKTGQRVFKDHVIQNVGGIRIAIVGFTDPDVPLRQPPSYSEGFEYLQTDILQPIIDKIRADKSADAVVLLTHIGLPKAVALADELKGVDVILSADTHERTYDPVIRGSTWVVEPGAFGSFLGRLDLRLKPDGSIEKNWDLIELRATRYSADSKIEKMTEAAIAPYRERLAKPIGETASTLYRYAVNETSLDAVLADALRDSTGTQIALSNGFRFAYPILKGTVTEQDLWNAYPISNNLRTGKVTGKQLREFWEREIENVYSKNPKKLFGGWLPRPSGMYVKFDADAEKGKRVKSIKIENKEVSDKGVYTITTCAREGDPATTLCRIPNGMDVKDLDFDAHEAVRRYFRKNSPVKAPTLKRVEAVDRPEHMRSQFYGR